MAAFAHELLDAARAGDREAAERLLEANSGLIWSVARRFFGRGVEGDDLYQLGCVGFLKALGTFDPAYGTRFSTYAVPKISGEIRRFLRDDGPVKVSRSLKERSAVVRAAREKLTQRLGREPRLTELSGETGLLPEEIAETELAVSGVDSLQQSLGEDGLTLQDVLSDPEQEGRLLERLALREAVAGLPERERSVIALRYWRGLTQAAAARLLGVSQVQVSRLERRALEQLRKRLE
ncbi:MAG: sigma-70 family RNA polymerase sigma factor [Oscillospiraceae bacterium]|nr:sigma-70 family RNA polymerase sigma factor [Oscillospiraceae bacterium]